MLYKLVLPVPEGLRVELAVVAAVLREGYYR